MSSEDPHPRPLSRKAGRGEKVSLPLRKARRGEKIGSPLSRLCGRGAGGEGSSESANVAQAPVNFVGVYLRRGHRRRRRAHSARHAARQARSRRHSAWARRTARNERQRADRSARQLGRRLFFDPILSADNTVACASCHQPEHGFAHQSRRRRRAENSRPAPMLLNRAFGKAFFWDGRAATLEEQACRSPTRPRWVPASPTPCAGCGITTSTKSNSRPRSTTASRRAISPRPSPGSTCAAPRGQPRR